MKNHSVRFVTNEITIGKFQMKVAQIADPEILFDELLSKPSSDADIEDERIPYWSELWPSAIALSQFIELHPEIVNGKYVLEIGCGVALPGITAALCGGNVTLTDYLPAAIEAAEYNWKLNIKSDPGLKLLDWRNPSGINAADVLLASDVAYESRSFEPLVKAFSSLVKKDGIILLSEPNRKFTKDFFSILNKNNFSATKENRIIIKDSIEYNVSVWSIKHL